EVSDLSRSKRCRRSQVSGHNAELSAMRVAMAITGRSCRGANRRRVGLPLMRSLRAQRFPALCYAPTRRTRGSWYGVSVERRAMMLTLGRSCMRLCTIGFTEARDVRPGPSRLVAWTDTAQSGPLALADLAGPLPSEPTDVKEKHMVFVERHIKVGGCA